MEDTHGKRFRHDAEKVALSEAPKCSKTVVVL